ncbi:MAG TPA: SpoIIE family protein phosphatase [Gaiellales bacterium]|nr:SpoIIE family protein phosphatase [Gaiellales bacterium]
MDTPTNPAPPGIEWLQQRLQYLQALSAALAAARSEQRAIDATLDSGIAVFEADQAVVAILDDGGAAFSVRALRGYSGRTLQDWGKFPNSDEFPLSEAVRHQRPVITQGEADLIARYPKLGGTARSATLVCLPLGETAGVALGYDTERHFTDAELEFMMAVAQQCGEAILRSQLDEERRRRSRRLALLAEAGQVFARTLDYRETLADVANLAVPQLADCCIVDVVEPGGLHQLATVHVEPGRMDRIAELERRYPADAREPRSPVGAVLRAGEATVLPEITELFLETMTRDEAHRQALRELGLTSLIIAPLVARGRTLGAITFIQDVSGRHYDAQDLATAESLADRAAVAIDNARLHQAQVDIATTLQRGLLPLRLPELEGIELATRYVAAGEGQEVGGDFYDVWELPDGAFGVAIGDVSGKGAEAAAMTALARDSIRVASLHEPTPSRVLTILNGQLRTNAPSDLFCTAAYCYAQRSGDGGLDLTVGLGGHPFGLVRRLDGSVETAGRVGTLLGLAEPLELTDHRLHLAPGELLLFYTDGVTEHRKDGEMFGEERLMELLAGVPDGTRPDALLRTLEQALQDFAATPKDDIAMIALRAASQPGPG